jgi:hypothetical protein
MGKGAGGGGEAQYTGPPVLRRAWSFDRLAAEVTAITKSLGDDLRTLKHLWFSKKAGAGASHAERLEVFYSPQASSCRRA